MLDEKFAGLLKSSSNVPSHSRLPFIFQDAGKEMSMNLKLNLSIVNALWYLLTGEHFDLEDAKLQAIVAKFDAVLRLELKNTPLSIFLEGVWPDLVKLTSPGFGHMTDLFTDIKDLVKKSLDEHKASFDAEHPRDFMDIYLAEIGKTDSKNSSFHGKRGEESLISTMLDLFLAGKNLEIPAAEIGLLCMLLFFRSRNHFILFVVVNPLLASSP